MEKKYRKIKIICVVIIVVICFAGFTIFKKLSNNTESTKFKEYQSKIIFDSQRRVKNNLNFPSSAVFEKNPKISINLNNYIISSYVDAKNELGKTSRAKFVGKYKEENNELKFIELQIDGKVVEEKSYSP